MPAWTDNARIDLYVTDGLADNWHELKVFNTPEEVRRWMETVFISHTALRDTPCCIL